MTPTVISSSGKVLLAGGYLVLDPLYPGLVISTSSRFFTVIQESASRVVPGQIHVRSPQFVEATWHYATRVKDGRLLVEQVKHESEIYLPEVR
jgi:phosphomevalonate kinase